MSRKYSRLEYLIVAILGISFPLITMRINILTYSLSLFNIMLLVMIFFNYKLVKKLRFYKEDAYIYLFLLVTFFSLLYSVNSSYGMIRWIKLVNVIIMFSFIRNILIYKKDYLSIFCKWMIYSYSLYMSYLIYIYIFKFKMSYIGIEVGYPTRSGKNSLALMVVVALPITLEYYLDKFLDNSMKIIDYLFVSIAIVSTILIQSRALYLILMYYLLIFIKRNFSVKITKGVLVILISLILLSSILLPEGVKNDIITRFSSIKYVFVDPDKSIIDNNYSGINSIESRSSYITKGIDMFLEKPLTGQGMGSFMFYGEQETKISHNDYILVLSEQGIIGICIFVLMLIKFYKFTLTTSDDYVSKMVFTAILFYFSMINAYDHIFIWTLFAVVSSNDKSGKRVLNEY